jgi:hypothetical protein
MPEPFIKPLVKSVRSEFTSLYAHTRADISHTFATMHQPVTVSILPVTAVYTQAVLPAPTVGCLSEYGRRIGLAEISNQERKNRTEMSFSGKGSLKKGPSLSGPIVDASEATALRQDISKQPSMKPLPLDKLRNSQEATAKLIQARVRRFSPDRLNEFNSFANSSVIENFPDSFIEPQPKTPPHAVLPDATSPAAAVRGASPTAHLRSRSSEGIRVTLDVSVEPEHLSNLHEIEELLSDAEKLLKGENITEEEIQRELRFLGRLGDSGDLRNSWSDIELELETLRRELGTN